MPKNAQDLHVNASHHLQTPHDFGFDFDHGFSEDFTSNSDPGQSLPGLKDSVGVNSDLNYDFDRTTHTSPSNSEPTGGATSPLNTSQQHSFPLPLAIDVATSQFESSWDTTGAPTMPEVSNVISGPSFASASMPGGIKQSTEPKDATAQPHQVFRRLLPSNGKHRETNYDFLSGRVELQSSNIARTARRRRKKVLDRSFLCDICNIRFQEPKDLESHQNSYKHIEVARGLNLETKPQKLFKCSFCSHSAPRKDNLERHERTKHKRQRI